MDGILIVNKPQNMTSRDVVNIVSRELKTKKIGHTGTLDPLATGVLVLAVNKATKIIELLVSNDKEYIAEVKMGLLTDTLDITGNVLEKKTVPSDNMSKLPLILQDFIGTYNQEVPIYSAVKVNGRRLYDYARNNEKVSLPKREVIIKEIELLDSKEESFKFKCSVSKGTYIRSLIRDIGDKLDIPCTMSSLIRTKQGIFSLSEAFTLDDIKEGKYHLISIMEALSNYPQVIVTDEIEKKVSNGVVLPKMFEGSLGVLLNNNQEILAIYQEDAKDKNLMRPWKVFTNN